MGRLPALASFALIFAPLALCACDQNKDAPPPPPVSGRSNAVAAKGTAEPVAAPVATSLKTTAPRKLCESPMARPAPSGSLKTRTAANATPLPQTIGFGVGKWVWLNLWAAWCEPCKEEMPRLLAWREKLRSKGVLLDLAFVSIDDDERQLTRFLDAQPETGVRASYWLEERERPSFMAVLGLPANGELPAHALVAPGGQIACTIQGALEDRDYPALASFLGAKP